MECGLRGTPCSQSTVHGVHGLMAPVTQLLPSLSRVYDAPSFSANPTLVVASGGNVSLSCSSPWPRGSFHLLKEGGADVPQYLELTFRRKRYQAVFLVGPVNTSHGGTYRCYISPESYPYLWSQPSNPLHLQVTGVYREPSLSAQPGSLVQSGDSLTLLCRSETGFDRFALTKDEELRAPQRLDGQPSPNFTLGPVSRSHGGQYRCYCGHKLSSTWSAPSAPLDVLITGMYEKPTLSAQPGPSVSWGENVTLQCRSEVWFDSFHLSKEGSLAPPQVLHLQDTAIPYQVKFTLSPVTSDHEGTYRCYSSHSNSPYLLSQPSDPLELLVSGPHWYLYVLIGVSVAFVLLLGLLGLLLVRHRRRGKGRKPGPVRPPLPRRSPCMLSWKTHRLRKTDSWTASLDLAQHHSHGQLPTCPLRVYTTGISNSHPSSPGTLRGGRSWLKATPV
ncbi:leukocyte immunoglobulin-like receptor subfamily B member 3 isoform X3 [Zalophus californianus]|uniref:Leukocyte immunoglobulin-like receptor subfamily B member 3 isoform X3 n=1 Tax=Zalophus californianus TaxID=9704 RepID=A0A6P9F675_ZALCA|nr:leukocyte immunoglobulin-like receptor subfamily B member 3 isoform X3 [Zalophus californianus]